MLKYGVYYNVSSSVPKLITSFFKKSEAVLKIRHLNVSISPNEKKYFGMEYKVKMVRI